MGVFGVFPVSVAGSLRVTKSINGKNYIFSQHQRTAVYDSQRFQLDASRSFCEMMVMDCLTCLSKQSDPKKYLHKFWETHNREIIFLTLK